MKNSPFLKKLPGWAEVQGLLLPPSISLEQCSSEKTALYKQGLVARLLPCSREKMTDLTGGYGVDFSFLSQLFKNATYVERNEELCKIAQHNFPLLQMQNVQILNTEAEVALASLSAQDLIFLDPARRSDSGRKVLLVEDCTPDVSSLISDLQNKCQILLLKLSPMLDISRSFQSLGKPAEVHIVSVQGECKELLLVYPKKNDETVVFCHDDKFDFSFLWKEESGASAVYTDTVKTYLYEPGAAVLKSGAFCLMCEKFGVEKLHPNTHLYTSDHLVKNFPGRVFRVNQVSGFGKRDIRALLSTTPSANLTVRNFPGTVAELRKRFKLKDGGEDYWFATTLNNSKHVVIATKKVENI